MRAEIMQLPRQGKAKSKDGDAAIAQRRMAHLLPFRVTVLPPAAPPRGTAEPPVASAVSERVADVARKITAIQILNTTSSSALG